MWLRIICDWLGEEFARLRTTINQHVDMFKADNIDRISDLPSPQTVVHRLFPHSMIVLMLRWMDNTDNQSTSSDRQTVDFSDSEDSLATSKASIDHSYIANDCQESKLFSFIQLILEFANGSLVSGIAHVLYPRLLQAQL